MSTNSLKNKANKQKKFPQLLINGNKFALNIAWQLLCYVLHLYPSLLKIRPDMIRRWRVCCALEVSWHSKVRGLERSGHLFTILCTLVSGFLFDFPKAGAQGGEIEMHRFFFLNDVCKNNSWWILAAFSACAPPGFFAVKHNIFSYVGPSGSEPSCSSDQGMEQDSKTFNSKGSELTWAQFATKLFLWGASLYGFFFFPQSKVIVPRIMCRGKLLYWGLGVSAINPLQK